MRKLIKFDLTRMIEISHVCKLRMMTPTLKNLKIGMAFGLYAEPIEKIERGQSLEKTPRWFDPRNHRGHLAVHAQDGRCAYISLTVNEEKRAMVHPFDNIISANAVRRTEQMNFLSQIDIG